MKKLIPALVICIIFINSAFAKSDTTLYYMKQIQTINSSNNAEDAIPANGKEDATFIRAVIKPVDKADSLFTINDYYLNGKLKFTGKSRILFKKKTPDYPLKLQGVSVEYFPNGHKRRIVAFENNVKTGKIMEYFPNGRLNVVKAIPEVDVKAYRLLGAGLKTEIQIDAFRKLMDSVRRPILKQCLDSVGNILAENGEGKWVEYQTEYNTPFAEGTVKNGLRNGAWHGKINDTLNYFENYRNGTLLDGKSYTVKGNEYIYNEESIPPKFPGGTDKLAYFLGTNINYPADARENGVQGNVLLQFQVNIDGTLSDIRVVRSVYPSIDAEAFKALTKSPGWIPGYSYGIKTNVVCTIPVSFTMVNDNKQTYKPINISLASLFNLTLKPYLSAHA